jgi:hypothetical protein
MTPTSSTRRTAKLKMTMYRPAMRIASLGKLIFANIGLAALRACTGAVTASTNTCQSKVPIIAKAA